MSQRDLQTRVLTTFGRARLTFFRRRSSHVPFLTGCRLSRIDTDRFPIARHLADPLQRRDALARDGLELRAYACP